MSSIKLIDSLTERTTAATDLLLAIQGIAWTAYLLPLLPVDSWKVSIWSAAFALLAVAGLCGAIVHGFQLTQPTIQWLWRGISLSLGLTISLFLVGVSYDVAGLLVSQITLPLAMVLGVGFFLLTQFYPKGFILFILYETVALLIALLGYGWLSLLGSLNGAGWLLLGVTLTLLAAFVQTRKSWQLTLIWPFDNNGLFHLIQLLANGFILIGLSVALGSIDS